MTTIRLIVTLLFVATTIGLLWNIYLTEQSYRDLQDVNARRLNGVRQVLATSRFRRHVLRLCKQFGLAGLWFPRVAWDNPASIVWAFCFGLLLVTALLFETYQDWADRHRIFWFMELKNDNHG